LKEASQISGYAPDYIGQLIRKGKLSGKQVYSSVAWMTTEKALREYIRDMGEAKVSRVEAGPASKVADMFRRFFNRLVSDFEVVRLYTTALYVIISLSVACSILLFYILSVTIDARFSRHAELAPVVVDIQPVTDRSPL
jgi:hypothetical protein